MCVRFEFVRFVLGIFSILQQIVSKIILIKSKCEYRVEHCFLLSIACHDQLLCSPIHRQRQHTKNQDSDHSIHKTYCKRCLYSQCVLMSACVRASERDNYWVYGPLLRFGEMKSRSYNFPFCACVRKWGRKKTRITTSPHSLATDSWHQIQTDFCTVVLCCVLFSLISSVFVSAHRFFKQFFTIRFRSLISI